MRAGAAQGAANVVYLMLSSGVGGGLVLDGSLFTGHSGMTGELGHVPVDPDGALCRCGNRGCLETVAGAQPLLEQGALRCTGRSRRSRTPPVWRAPGIRTVRAVFRAAGAGRRPGRRVGICNVVNPELVIVGGDLILAGDMLVDAVREGLAQTSHPAVRGRRAGGGGDARGPRGSCWGPWGWRSPRPTSRRSPPRRRTASVQSRAVAAAAISSATTAAPCAANTIV